LGVNVDIITQETNMNISIVISSHDPLFYLIKEQIKELVWINKITRNLEIKDSVPNVICFLFSIEPAYHVVTLDQIQL
jgi:hypothetical protein